MKYNIVIEADMGFEIEAENEDSAYKKAEKYVENHMNDFAWNIISVEEVNN